MKPDRDWLQREGSGLGFFLILGVLLLSVVPLVRLIGAAVAPGGALNLASLYGLATPQVWTVTGNTLVVGIGSGIVALILGATLSLALAITDIGGKRATAFFFLLSLMISPQVVALAFKTLAGPASPLLNLFGLAPEPGTANPVLGAGGIILVMGLHHAPLAAITLAAGLATVPKSMIEAAAIDGASPWRIVRRIILPLLRPYCIAAAMIVFVAGVGNFGIPALLGLPVGYATLPTLVYQKLASFGPSLLSEAAAVSLLVAMISGAGVLSAAIALPRDQARLDAEEMMLPFWKLGRLRRPMELSLWLFIAASFLLPCLSLLATSLVPAYGVTLSLDSLTFTQFYEVLVRQDLTLRAFRNSLLFAGSAALSLAVMAVLFAYALDRLLPRYRTAAAILIEMPYALPGIVVAISCILLFLKPLPIINISIYATPWIIVFAYHARFLPLAMKPALAAMSLISRDQEEAAAVHGSRLWQRLRYIVLPRLIAPAAAGALMVFLLAFNELTVSALLWTSGTETLGVALLNFDDAGLGSESAAVGVSAILIVTALMVVLDRLSPYLPDGILPWRVLILQR